MANLVSAGVAGQQNQGPPRPTESSVIVPVGQWGTRTPRPLFSDYCPNPGTNLATTQIVHQLPATVPTPVTALAFRRGDYPTTARVDVPQYTVTIEAWMGHSTRPPWNLDRRYAVSAR